MNERITFWRKDKIPYGTWYAYEQMENIFPQAYIDINTKSPDKSKAFKLTDVKTYLPANDDNGEKQLMVIIAPAVEPDQKEVNALFDFVGRGNHIFISAFEISDALSDSLHLSMPGFSSLSALNDSLKINIETFENFDTVSFTYPGYGFGNYINKLDSNITTIIGNNDNGKANLIVINYKSGGSITLHAEPFAFTNFFLLHKNNKTYYEEVFANLPANIDKVLWDDYFRNADRKKDFSAWHVIMGNRSLKWALYATLLMFGLLIFSEVKRRQRIIPVIQPLQNSSADFVKTIGRLYYQQRDNQNIALKMVTHFKDHVRSRYNMQPADMNEEFVKTLSFKSGLPIKMLQDVVYKIKMIEDFFVVDDEMLLQFDQQLDKFYKTNT
jgi:hypothetical protein